MNDPHFNNNGSISVGGAMVVGNDNTVHATSAPTSSASADASLQAMLAQIQRAAFHAHLPGSVLAEVVSRAGDAQRCLSDGQNLQVGEVLLRTYAALDAAVAPHAAAELRQMLETAARMAVELEP
ncbi:MAG TPA: hypothetical protein VFS20_27975 [Longimicrobium sp.]|nr:hypothetical protein [Longimicrobium sp.]